MRYPIEKPMTQAMTQSELELALATLLSVPCPNEGKDVGWNINGVHCGSRALPCTSMKRAVLRPTQQPAAKRALLEALP